MILIIIEDPIELFVYVEYVYWYLPYKELKWRSLKNSLKIHYILTCNILLSIGENIYPTPPKKKSEKMDISLHILQFSSMSNLIDDNKVFHFLKSASASNLVCYVFWWDI